MDEDEYLALDAVAMAEAVATGQVRPKELLAAARARADTVNPVLNAVVRWLPEQADAQVDGEPTGPLAGVPFLTKDFGQWYAGVPLSDGSRALAERRPTEHSTVVRRWLDAGLVVFGQTNVPEFAAKGVTEPELFGPARNPWDTTRTPGGSSGGAAAAVAAGIVPAAGASDGGGSIRIPAACCGLFGLKVGRGVLPAGPTQAEGFHGAAVDGVISRSVRDTAALLDVLRGDDPAAPYALARAILPWRDEVGRSPGRLRIAVRVENDVTPDVSAEARAAVADAAELLTDLGHLVEEAPVAADAGGLAEDFLLPWFVHVAAAVEEAGTRRSRANFEFDTRIMAAIGRATSAWRHEVALSRWHAHTRALAALHERYDLLLTPTLAQPPVPIGSLDTAGLERWAGSLVLALRAGWLLPRLGVVASAIQRNLAWVPYTQLANLTGRPAASVPLYWTPDGLPLGVQFVGRVGAEPLLLRLAAQLEQARPWADRRPPPAPATT